MKRVPYPAILRKLDNHDLADSRLFWLESAREWLSFARVEHLSPDARLRYRAKAGVRTRWARICEAELLKRGLSLPTP